jgi:hypothetical protein
VPPRGPALAAREQLLDGGTRLASAYQALGYRGYLSADAVITPAGRAVFTEVNAQVSGSLHIYQVIDGRIVKTSAAPQRTVAEYHSPASWRVSSLGGFLDAAGRLGCGWDPGTRTGVIASMPLIPGPDGAARFLFCIASDGGGSERGTLARLDSHFTTAPATAGATA